MTHDQEVTFGEFKFPDTKAILIALRSYFYVFFFKRNLFGCAGSQLQHAGSLVAACMWDLVP